MQKCQPIPAAVTGARRGLGVSRLGVSPALLGPENQGQESTHSPNKYLLLNYYRSDTALGMEDTQMEEIAPSKDRERLN